MNYVTVPEGTSGRRLTRAETKARTRERILDAAERVFAQRGFAAATVEEIAETAGYTIGALYSNFEGKEQLFTELLSAHRTSRVASVAETIEEARSGPEAPLRSLARLFAEMADNELDLAALQTEFWLYAIRNPTAMDALAAQVARQMDAFERIVDEALERNGVDPAVSARELTVVVFALVQGLVRQRRIDRDRVPDALFAQALRWIFKGVRSDAADSGSTQRPAPTG